MVIAISSSVSSTFYFTLKQSSIWEEKDIVFPYFVPVRHSSAVIATFSRKHTDFGSKSWSKCRWCFWKKKNDVLPSRRTRLKHLVFCEVCFGHFLLGVLFARFSFGSSVYRVVIVHSLNKVLSSIPTVVPPITP